MPREALHQDVRLPDERVRLGQDGRRAARRATASRRPTIPTRPTSSCSTPARCARRRRKRCSPISAACKHLKRARPGVLIGVGGCVASQEGAAIVARAPYVDLVFGPQTLHRLPQMIAARARAAASRRSTSRFPRSRSSTTCRRPRVEGATAFVSIMEGCSKYCTFCVVPYTRGEEVSRPFDDVLTEVAELAAAGREGSHAARPERECLSRRARTTATSPTSRCCSSTSPRFPASSASATPPRIRRNSRQRLIDAYAKLPQAREPRASAGAVRLRPRARRDEARLHRARIQVDHPPAARRASRTSRSRRTSSSAFPARPTPISRRR